MIDAGLICEVSDLPNSMAATGVGVCRVPVPFDVIVGAVRWYLRYNLSYGDVEELQVERGIEVDHVTIYRWVQRFTPLLADAARFALVRRLPNAKFRALWTRRLFPRRRPRPTSLVFSRP